MAFIKYLLSLMMVLGFQFAFGQSNPEENTSPEAPRSKARGEPGTLETKAERFQSRLRRAVRQWSFAVGPFFAFESRDDQPIYTGSVYRHWETSAQGEFRVGVNAAAGSDERFINLSAGGNYLFSPGSWTPMIGAEAGFGRSRVYVNNREFESQSGLTYAVQGGARFFRLSDTQMEVLAQYMGMATEDNPAYIGAQLRFIF